MILLLIAHDIIYVITVFFYQVWPMRKCYIKWSMGIVCQALLVVQRHFTTSCSSVGIRTPWNDLLSKPSSGSLRTFSPWKARSTRRHQPTESTPPAQTGHVHGCHILHRISRLHARPPHDPKYITCIVIIHLIQICTK